MLSLLSTVAVSLSDCTVIEILAIRTNRLTEVTVLFLELFPAVGYLTSRFSHCFWINRSTKFDGNQEKYQQDDSQSNLHSKEAVRCLRKTK
jgi:hypothetical protein